MTLLKAIYHNHTVTQLPAVALTRKVLSSIQLRPFQQLAVEHVKPRPYVRGHQQRMGTGNTENLSRYRTLKEYSWPKEFLAALQPLSAVMEREAARWMLYFGKGDFLDEQDAWLDRSTPVDFYAVALFPNQLLTIDGRTYKCSAGDALQFAPSYRHAVPVFDREAAWLCFMVFRSNDKVQA
ncbi:hypothetical protein [Pseudomonas simiae]|uniref:hypothetical protein n=1 Tax=Pseudomonas simiae TaxID=321846 RepID=UPI0006456DF0|nr:hypothetical protein [Pseudomonas simiae]